jgi:hypothetical protein
VIRRVATPLVVLAALSSVLAGCGGARAAKGGVVYRVVPGRGLSASTFAEVDVFGVGVLADLRTGRQIRTLLPARRGRFQLVDLARDAKKALVATYGGGPRCTSGVAGCGPKPDTCGGLVVRLDPAAGKLTKLAQFGSDTQVVATRPNAAGTELAILVAPCVPSYFNQHIEVLRIADGATWSIGAKLPRCHSLGPPAWIDNGADLLMSYGAAEGSRPYDGSDGTCSQSQPSVLLKVPAQSGQPGLTGIRRSDTPHCSYTAVASQGSAIYAISACATYRRTAPDVLEKLDSALHPVGHWSVGQCEDGDSLALNPSGSVLLSAYLFCNPPLKGTKGGGPTTDLDLLAHNRIQHLTHTAGGDLVYSSLAW